MFLHQFSNFIQSPSKYLRSETILFGVTVSGATNIYAPDILLSTISVILVFSELSFSVILNDPNIYSSASIPVASCLVLSILFIQKPNYNAVSMFLQQPNHYDILVI